MPRSGGRLICNERVFLLKRIVFNAICLHEESWRKCLGVGYMRQWLLRGVHRGGYKGRYLYLQQGGGGYLIKFFTQYEEVVE